MQNNWNENCPMFSFNYYNHQSHFLKKKYLDYKNKNEKGNSKEKRTYWGDA